MHSQINKILAEIDKKKEELHCEYKKLREKYDFEFNKKWKVFFSKQARQKNKAFKTPLLKYIFTPTVRNLLSAPFIYMMIIPAVVLDIFLTVYQHICFRLYDIPRVKRKNHIVYDRQLLDYLNIVEKANCMYCSYVNGLFSYAVEIGGRTEKYWCPIKNARKMGTNHKWEKYFADYGDPQWFNEEYNNNTCFKKEK